MESTNRGQPPYIKQKILANPRRYSFVQAVRLLRFCSEKPADFSEYFKNSLRIKPLLSLGFPATDVYRIDEENAADHPLFRITATFLGLYGPASPLPTYYTEDLLDEAQAEKTVQRDFLDIFNTLFFELFYQGWAKYRWYVKLFDEADQRYFDRLFCLLGLGQESFRDKVPNSRGLLRYIGLFSQFPRSASGLRALVADACNLPQAEVEQCVPQMASIPSDQRCFLGRQGHTLGDNCYLGEEIADITGKIRIFAGVLDGDKFHELLPDTTRFSETAALVKFYLAQPVDCEWSLRLKENEARPIALGRKMWGQLGYNTWLISENKLAASPVVNFNLNEEKNR